MPARSSWPTAARPLASAYAGLRIPARLQAMLRGHMRRVREAVNAEAKGPTSKTHAVLVHATERLALVIERAIQNTIVKIKKHWQEK